MTIVADSPTPVDTLVVNLGVDTRADTHVAAVIDPLGRHLGHASFDTTVAGFGRCLAGRPSSARSPSLRWRAPAATGPGWPVS